MYKLNCADIFQFSSVRFYGFRYAFAGAAAEDI